MTKKPAAFVAYLRVSTVRQGESGLGLEAQRTAVEAFARQHGGAIVASFVEVETGKRSTGRVSGWTRPGKARRRS